MAQASHNIYELHYKSSDASYRFLVDTEAQKLLIAQRKHAGFYVDVSVQAHQVLSTVIDFADLLGRSEFTNAISHKCMPRWSLASVDFRTSATAA